MKAIIIALVIVSTVSAAKLWPFENLPEQTAFGKAMDKVEDFFDNLWNWDFGSNKNEAEEVLEDLFAAVKDRKSLFADSQDKAFSFHYKNGKEEGFANNVQQFATGFIMMYPMPAMDEDNCVLEKVIWNNPFVRVQLFNSFGMTSDSVKFYQQDTNDLWDIAPLKVKMMADDQYQKFLRILIKNYDSINSNLAQYRQKSVMTPINEQDKEVVDFLNKLFAEERNEMRGSLATPFQTIPFNKITGFFRPNINTRMGVCQNFLGFMKELSVTDPTITNKIIPEDWAKANCVVLHHDTGTGRTLVCHTQSNLLADGIISFLNNNVDQLTSNCEFLARHLRYERESIKRFIENTKKSGMARRRRR